MIADGEYIVSRSMLQGVDLETSCPTIRVALWNNDWNEFRGGATEYCTGAEMIYHSDDGAGQARTYGTPRSIKNVDSLQGLLVRAQGRTQT